MFRKWLAKRACKRSIESSNDLSSKLDNLQLLIGKFHSERVSNLSLVNSLHEVEFSVFSQWGEDGIIQYLVNNVPIKNKIFVEIGIENYTECNTRFLLINNNWEGLAIDGNSDQVADVAKSAICWQYPLDVCSAFVDRENIDSVLQCGGVSGDIGLLSIDIDGNDYWLWDAISVVKPRIVVCEYNSLFGSDHPVTVPYDALFERGRAHYTNQYYGASLSALCSLAERKGYDFVGSNSVGSNAFFVRSGIGSKVPAISASEGYVATRIREGRSKSGELNLLSAQESITLIQDLPLVHVPDGSETTLRTLY